MKEEVSYVEKILINEVGNKENIYLYFEEGNWCAYERSAYFLIQLNAPVQLKKEVIRNGYDVVLLKATMSSIYMNFSGADIQLKSFGETDAQFKLSGNIEGFPEWKMSQLNVFSA